jgi:hypothetical protein
MSDDEGPKKKKESLLAPDKLKKALRYYSCLVAALMSAFGVFGLFTSGVNVVSIVISFWLIAFGPLIIFAENGNTRVRTYFKFMSNR